MQKPLQTDSNFCLTVDNVHNVQNFAIFVQYNRSLSWRSQRKFVTFTFFVVIISIYKNVN